MPYFHYFQYLIYNKFEFMNWKSLLILLGIILIEQTTYCQSHNISTITNLNRNYANMFGGWGPHLRSIMRSEADEQWMAIDDGADVYHNDLIRYYRLGSNQSTWSQVGQSNIASYEVQQNMAHTMSGNTINSYGIELTGLDAGNVYTNRIVNVKYNTQTNTSTTNYIEVNGSINLQGTTSNYIGAAINPSNGLEVVWWHVSGSPPATFKLIWKYPFQPEWNGPLVMDELVNGNAYNMFLYVYGTFVGDNRLELVAQSGLYNVSGTPDFYLPAHQTIDFGFSAAIPSGFSWMGNSATAANNITDIWKNPCNDDLHVLGYDFDSGDAIYYYKEDGGTSWEDWQYIGRIPNRFNSKFSYDSYLDSLTIVNNDFTSVYSSKLRVSELLGSIDLNNLIVESFPISELNSGGSSGLYVQRAAMQTNPATRYQFASVGKNPTYDNLIRYVKYDNVDLVDTISNVCEEPACPDLTPIVSAIPSSISGNSTLGIAVELFQIAENKTDGSSIKIRIPQDPRFTFNWNPALTNVGFTPVLNSAWKYLGNNGLFHEFEYSKILGPNHRAAFGVVGNYDPQNTSGSTTLTVTVVPGSSNECVFINNSDAEIISYFD